MPDSSNLPASSVQNPTDELEKELNDAAEATKQSLHQDPQAAAELADSPTMQDAVVDVERDLLDEILKRLEQNEMSPEDAQKHAKEFLSFLPVHDQKDLLKKLYQLSQDASETQGIYLKYAQPYEEFDRHKKLKLMSEHLQNGKIEEALAVAKGETKNA